MLMHLTCSCIDSSELLAEIDHNLIEEMAEEFACEETPQAMLIKNSTEMAERNLKICSKEIRPLGKLKKFINHLLIFGFNFSGYDIPFIKNYFLPELVRLVPSEASIQFVKKTTNYVSINVNGLCQGGGFVFLDIIQFWHWDSIWTQLLSHLQMLLHPTNRIFRMNIRTAMIDWKRQRCHHMTHLVVNLGRRIN